MKNLKMKIITLVVFLIFSTSAISQNKEKVLLEWKIAKNDTLRYVTTMNPTTEETEDSNPKDTGAIFSANDFKKIQKSLQAINSNSKYQTKLFVNKKDAKLIDIEMLMLNDQKDDSGQSLNEMLSQKQNGKKKKGKNKTEEKENDSLDFKNLYKSLAGLNGNIVLRGRITTTGEIVSTYYKSSQTNLIATLFELPNRKVEIGEKWKLNVHLIQMDQNFTCDSLNIENSAYIEKIIEKEGDKIAVIQYNLSEYVIGDFNNPMGAMFGMSTEDKTYMKMSHVATAYFSINKGKWITYEGVMEIDTNFSMLGGKSKTVFKLVE